MVEEKGRVGGGKRVGCGRWGWVLVHFVADSEFSTYWSVCRRVFTTPLLFPPKPQQVSVCRAHTTRFPFKVCRHALGLPPVCIHNWRVSCFYMKRQKIEIATALGLFVHNKINSLLEHRGGAKGKNTQRPGV